MDFDATKPFMDVDYNAFIDQVIHNATGTLRQACENQHSPDQAIRDHLTTACTAGISASEAVDLSGVITPKMRAMSGKISNNHATLRRHQWQSFPASY
jgi:hypothetical protein